MAVSRVKQDLSVRQRGALSNAVNLSILIFLLQRPATLMEVADAHQLLPLEANLRLRHLMEEGLVASTLREEPGGSSERVFHSLVDDFELHSQAGADGLGNAQQIQLILSHLKRDLTYHAFHPDEGKVHIRMIGIRLKPEQLEQWLSRVKALEQEFDEADDTAEEAWHFLTVALYSKPKRDRK
jgi:hypothetical protein